MKNVIIPISQIHIVLIENDDVVVFVGDVLVQTTGFDWMVWATVLLVVLVCHTKEPQNCDHIDHTLEDSSLFFWLRSLMIFSSSNSIGVVRIYSEIELFPHIKSRHEDLFAPRAACVIFDILSRKEGLAVIVLESCVWHSLRFIILFLWDKLENIFPSKYSGLGWLSQLWWLTNKQ